MAKKRSGIQSNIPLAKGDPTQDKEKLIEQFKGKDESEESSKVTVRASVDLPKHVYAVVKRLTKRNGQTVAGYMRSLVISDLERRGEEI